jgi:hypothetical protein
MKQAEIRGALVWYKRAVEAYEQLARRLAAASLASEPASPHQTQLREALDLLLPIVGECIAELPGLAAALTEELEASAKLRREAEEAGVRLRSAAQGMDDDL